MRGDQQVRRPVEVVGEILRRGADGFLPVTPRVALRPLRTRHRRVLGEVGRVDLGDLCLLRRVLDEHPVPPLAVASGRCLEGDFEALLDDRLLDRPVEVEPLAHGAGGGQQFVGGEVQVHATSWHAVGARGRWRVSRVPSFSASLAGENEGSAPFR
jgi:hypothetical protein